jgi:MSHA pilin protein MshD
MYVRMLKQRGATLVELVVSIVIVSIVVITLMVLTSQSMGRSVDPMIQEQASAIARAYLEEITQKSFCDPDFDVDSDPATPLDCPTDCVTSVCGGTCRNPGLGSQTEAARDLYDDICDYDGLSNSGAIDQTGSPVAGLSQYTISVQIVDDSTVSLNGLTGDAGETARMDVTVSHPAMNDDVRMSGFRANY